MTHYRVKSTARMVKAAASRHGRRPDCTLNKEPERTHRLPMNLIAGASDAPGYTLSCRYDVSNRRCVHLMTRVRCGIDDIDRAHLKGGGVCLSQDGLRP